MPNKLIPQRIDNIDALDADDLRALLPADDPFLHPGFLGAVERHGAASPELGWHPHHLVLRDAHSRLAAMLPLYLKTNSFGEFIYDWSWARAFEQAGIAYYPKLFTGLPYTPATGPRLWIRADQDRAASQKLLIDATIELAQAHGLSSWHVAFPDAADAQAFEAAGLIVRHDVQYHWLQREDAPYRDFVDYLAAFSADKRRKVRAERRKVREAGIEIDTLAGHEIPMPLWDDIHALYTATFDKYGNYPAFSARCLADIGKSLKERMVVFLARRGSTSVATAICFRSDTALFGRYWGAAERIDGLHFELCYYQGIDYCLRHGLQRFEPGAGGEHKIARGFEPVTVTTLHWIADVRMREALRIFLSRNAVAVERYAGEAGMHLPFK